MVLSPVHMLQTICGVEGYKQGTDSVCFNLENSYFLKIKKKYLHTSECQIKNEVRFSLTPKVIWVRCAFIMVKELANIINS